MRLRRSESGLGGSAYAEKEILKADRVVKLAKDGLLALYFEGHKVEFEVFEFLHGPSTDGSIGAFYDVVFHGEGFAGALRECRHTWWGDEGYVFYPSPELLASAFAALTEWFDF